LKTETVKPLYLWDCSKVIFNSQSWKI